MFGKKVPDTSLEVRLATGLEELQNAFRLLHDRYVQAGLQEPEPDGMRISFHHLLPVTATIVARRNEEVVGTLSVVNDSRAGLPMDDLFQAEVDEIRRSGARVCELSGLAVRGRRYKASRQILLALFKKAFILSHDLLQCTDVCIIINPRHATYYAGRFQFLPIGRVRPCKKVNNAPALPLRLNLSVAEELFRRRSPALYHYFFVDERREIRDRTENELVRQRSLLQNNYIEFLIESRQRLLDHLTAAEQEFFSCCYPWLDVEDAGLRERLKKQGARRQHDLYRRKPGDGPGQGGP